MLLYCTIQVYVGIHFCDIVTVCGLFEWKRVFAVFLSFVIFTVGDQIINRGGGGDPIKWFNPATFLCPSQIMTWISNIICCRLLCVQ